MNAELKTISRKVIPVLKKYKVIKAGIFGSYARNEQNKRSDVDILIGVNEGIDLIDLVRLRTKLQKAINKKVDLVQYVNIRKELKKSILNEEVKLI